MPMQETTANGQTRKMDSVDDHNILHAVKLSEAIITAIDESDLAKVALLDEERSRLINQYYRDTDFIDAKLTLQLKQLNDNIVSRLTAMQQAIRAQQVQLNNTTKVSQAYQGNMPKQLFRQV